MAALECTGSATNERIRDVSKYELVRTTSESLFEDLRVACTKHTDHEAYLSLHATVNGNDRSSSVFDADNRVEYKLGFRRRITSAHITPSHLVWLNVQSISSERLENPSANEQTKSPGMTATRKRKASDFDVTAETKPETCALVSGQSLSLHHPQDQRRDGKENINIFRGELSPEQKNMSGWAIPRRIRRARQGRSHRCASTATTKDGAQGLLRTQVASKQRSQGILEEVIPYLGSHQNFCNRIQYKFGDSPEVSPCVGYLGSPGFCRHLISDQKMSRSQYCWTVC